MSNGYENLGVLPTSLVTQSQSLSHVGSVTPRPFRWLHELRFVHCPLELQLHFFVQVARISGCFSFPFMTVVSAIATLHTFDGFSFCSIGCS
jgi:hypothetical protein